MEKEGEKPKAQRSFGTKERDRDKDENTETKKSHLIRPRLHSQASCEAALVQEFELPDGEKAG